MNIHQERERIARQMADMCRLRLQRAQAEESAALETVRQRRAAHERALDEQTQLRNGFAQALQARDRPIDVATIQQWMHAVAIAERDAEHLSGEREHAESRLHEASTSVHVSERQLEDTSALHRRARRQLLKKIDEKKLDATELLTRFRTL